MNFTFKRSEVKYIVNKSKLPILLKMLNSYKVFLDEYGLTTIQSLYYDTDDYLLVKRSLERPLYKEKIRLRSYGLASKNSNLFLELKKKYNGIVYKRRIKVIEDTFNSFIKGDIDLDTQIGLELNYFRDFYKTLNPKALIICERKAYYNEDLDLRVTFDENIRYRDYDLVLDKNFDGKLLIDDDVVLMEIKTSRPYPLWLSRFLSVNSIFKTSFSKYGNAYLDMHKNNLLN